LAKISGAITSIPMGCLRPQGLEFLRGQQLPFLKSLLVKPATSSENRQVNAGLGFHGTARRGAIGSGGKNGVLVKAPDKYK
jgi:hypothetical protein